MRDNERTWIFGSKVVLVPYKRRHVEKYHQWMLSEELREQTASERLTLDEEYAMQKKWLEDDDKCTFIVLDAKSFEDSGDDIDSMVGDTNLFFGSSSDRSRAEIEIMIADVSKRKKGFGKEALLLMIRYGIEELKVESFEAKINESNSASLHLFETIGFVKYGENRVFREVLMELKVTEVWLNRLKEDTFYDIRHNFKDATPD